MPVLILSNFLTKNFFATSYLKKIYKYVNFDSMTQSKVLTYSKLFLNSIQEKLSRKSGNSDIIQFFN